MPRRKKPIVLDEPEVEVTPAQVPEHVPGILEVVDEEAIITEDVFEAVTTMKAVRTKKVDVTPTQVPEPIELTDERLEAIKATAGRPPPSSIILSPFSAENLVIEEPTFSGSLGPKIKSVVVVDVNAGQAVYIEGVKVSGKERRRHMEDVCHSLNRGDVIELQHWHCAGCQMFEGQVREAGFPAKLSDLPEPRDEYVYPKP